MDAAYEQMEIHEMRNRVLQKLTNSQEKNQATFNQLADGLLEILATLRADIQKRSQRPQQTPTSLFIASESVGTLKATPRFFAESPPAIERTKPPSCELFGETKESRNIALHEQRESPEEDQPEAAEDAAEEDLPGEIDDTTDHVILNHVADPASDHLFFTPIANAVADSDSVVVHQLKEDIPQVPKALNLPQPLPERSKHISACFEIHSSPPLLISVPTSSYHQQSPPIGFDSMLQQKRNGFTRVTEQEGFVTPTALTPTRIPPPKPPDRVVEMMSPTNIRCAAIEENSLKTTPIYGDSNIEESQFSPCSAAINYLLCFEKVGHAVSTCVDNTDVSSYTMLLNASSRLRLVAYTHQVFDQMFDQILKCNLEAWNATITGCSFNRHEDVICDLFKDLLQLEVEPGNCIFPCMMSLCSLGLLNYGRHVHLLVNSLITVSSAENKVMKTLNPGISGVVLKNYGSIFVNNSYLCQLDDLSNVSPLVIITAASLITISFVFDSKLSNLLSMFIILTNEEGIVFMMMMDHYQFYNLKCIILGEVLAGYWLNAIGQYKGVFYERDTLILGHSVTIRGLVEAIPIEINDDTAFEGTDSNFSWNNVMMTMYSNLGSLDRSLGVFNALDARDAISCNDLTYTNSQLRCFEAVLATFTVVLSACHHLSLVHDAPFIFEKNYGFLPSVNIFPCLVVMLGHNEYLGGAKRLIEDEYVGVHSKIGWSLIHACASHENLRFGRMVASLIWEGKYNFCAAIDLCKEASLANGEDMLNVAYNLLAWKLGTLPLFAIFYPLTRGSLLLLFQQVKMVVVLHRKMINRGNVQNAKVLIKWKTLPPKHGTSQLSSLRTRMFEGAGIVTGNNY